jgi:hypothetical protein
MTEKTPLRAAVEALPLHEQVRMLVRIGGTLRAGLVALNDEPAETDLSLALAGRWAEGDAVTGAQFSELVYSENEQGVLRRLTDAQDGSPNEALWNALTTDIMYIAWLAYRQTGERMPEDVAEVDETTLDLLDEQWRATPVYDPSMLRASR